MELHWTFDFVKITDEFQVVSSRVYVNGNLIGEQNPEDKVMLLSYLALFPNRDILRIKIGSSQNSLYNLMYFDKRYKEDKFIGVFSFAEFNTPEPFISGLEDDIKQEIFGKFKEVFPDLFSKPQQLDIAELDKLNGYYKWMDNIIREFYFQWEDARTKYFGSKTKALQTNLANTFSTISGPLIQPIEEEENTNSLNKKIKLIIKDREKEKEKKENSQPKEIKEIEPPKEKIKLSINEIKSSKPEKIEVIPIKREQILDKGMDEDARKLMELNEKLDKIIQIDSESKKNPASYSRIWEIQLINTYGNPLTGIVRFKNWQYMEPSEDDFMTQGLEAMSYSVLKTLVDQKNLNLRHIKASMPGDKGIEYIFFHNVIFGSNNLLLIMRCTAENCETKICEDDLMGEEAKSLEKIGYELSQHPEWFKDNEYKIKNGQEEVSNIFYRNLKTHFKKIAANT